MLVTEYYGINLQSKEGLVHLLSFAKNNNMLSHSVDDVVDTVMILESDMACEARIDYYDTLRSAMPNCWD